MLNTGVLFLSAAISAAVLVSSLLLYCFFGKTLTPFAPNAFNILLCLTSFLVVAFGCAFGIARDSARRRQASGKGHTARWTTAASLFSGATAAVLINGTLHCLVSFSRSLNFLAALLLASIGVFLVVSFLYSMAIGLLKRRAD